MSDSDDLLPSDASLPSVGIHHLPYEGQDHIMSTIPELSSSNEYSTSEPEELSAVDSPGPRVVARRGKDLCLSTART